MSVLKLLLAIAQRAITPADDAEWSSLSSDSLAEKCLAYLEEHRDDFWLYGDKPFLQMPQILQTPGINDKDKRKHFKALLPEYPSKNGTILFQSQIAYPFPDAEKAMIIVQTSAFALSGKAIDNSISLSPGYSGKTRSGKVGPSLGFRGYQHSFYWGNTIPETVYMNLLTHEDIQATGMFEDGIGVPPWEAMPEGEDDKIAQSLKRSYIGRLVPVSRFMLIDKDEKLYYTEGIAHPSHKDGRWDTSTSIEVSDEKKGPRAIWTDTSKRPWRNVPAILGFMAGKGNMRTYQISQPYQRIRRRFNKFGIWAGGLRVSDKAGERYCAGTDDYLESVFFLRSSSLGELWYSKLETEMKELDHISRILWKCVTGYNKELMVQNQESVNKSVGIFWQLCETQFQKLLEACNTDEQLLMRKQFAQYVYQVYDRSCPRSSARQIQAWAKNKPQLSKYRTIETMKQEATIEQ